MLAWGDNEFGGLAMADMVDTNVQRERERESALFKRETEHHSHASLEPNVERNESQQSTADPLTDILCAS